MRVSATCLCGKVRLKGDAEPSLQVKCYCVDCRKSSAAGHAAMIGFPLKSISIEGEISEYRSKADSGRDVARAFCPVCGAGVYARNEAAPDMIFLRASILDDPSLFDPQVVVYASRAPAWDPVNRDIPSFPESPPRQQRSAQ